MLNPDEVKVTKKTMREQIADILRMQILRAEIVPGERVVEEELAKKYQVSRGPVREALRQLEEEGLLTYAPHKGCVVKILTADEMQESYLIRSTLECLSVRIFQGVMSDRGLQLLEDSIERIEDAAKDRNLYHIVEADEAFHSTIVEESKCEKLFKIWKLLAGANTAAYYTMDSQGLMPYDVLGRNHRKILALFQNHVDPELIIEAISAHYMVVPADLLKAQGKMSN